MVFSVHPEWILTEPKAFDIDPETPLTGALEALGSHLSATYFKRDGEEAGDQGGVRFAISALTTVPAGNRWLQVATIDLIDPRQTALRDFFQGSTGAQGTYFLLAATFLQPQRTVPLIDGMVLTYNGEPFPVMDHVQLRDIIVPGGALRRTVTQALLRTGASADL
jgi:hypothetical protein